MQLNLYVHILLILLSLQLLNNLNERKDRHDNDIEEKYIRGIKWKCKYKNYDDNDDSNESESNASGNNYNKHDNEIVSSLSLSSYQWIMREEISIYC